MRLPDPAASTQPRYFPVPAAGLAPAAPGGEKPALHNPTQHPDTGTPGCSGSTKGAAGPETCLGCCSPHVSPPSEGSQPPNLTHRWPWQPGEASLAALSGQTDDAALSCQALGTGGTVGTLRGGRGGGSDPVGRHHAAGGARREVSPPLQKAHRRAVLSGFAFLARGASGALEPGVAGTARGTGVATSTLGTVLASRARGAGGAWVTLRGRKTRLVQTEEASPPSPPTSRCCSGSGSAPEPQNPEKNPFLGAEERPRAAWSPRAPTGMRRPLCLAGGRRHPKPGWGRPRPPPDSH